MLLLKDLNTNSTTSNILSFKTINLIFKIWYFTIHITKEVYLHCCYNNYNDISYNFLFKLFLCLNILKFTNGIYAQIIWTGV